MRTRATPRGLVLTELALGAAQLGNLYRATTHDEVVATVEASWETGIRYFDTAPHYGVGLSERRLGEQLRRYPRDEYVVSTKVGRLLVPSPSTAHLRDDGGFDVPADPVRRWDFTRDGVLRSLEASLDRLGLDRLDIVYLHDPDDPEQFAIASREGIGALIELREQGVIRAVGAGMNAAGPLAEIIRRADVDIVMCANRFTLLNSEAVDELLPLASARGVAVAAAAVYNSGLLSAPRPRDDALYDYQRVSPELLARAHRIADIAEAHGVTLPALAVSYVLRHPAVATVVVGARGATQVRSNAERYATPVPEVVWDELEAAGLIAGLAP